MDHQLTRLYTIHARDFEVDNSCQASKIVHPCYRVRVRVEHWAVLGYSYDAQNLLYFMLGVNICVYCTEYFWDNFVTKPVFGAVTVYSRSYVIFMMVCDAPCYLHYIPTQGCQDQTAQMRAI